MFCNIGINWRERWLIQNLYTWQRVKLRLNQGKTDSLIIIEGESDRGVACHTHYLSYEVRFGDDMAIIAKTQEELQDRYGEQIGWHWKEIWHGDHYLQIISKSSRSDESLQNKVNNRELKEVDHFKFLGSVLTRDGFCTKEIKMRIAIANEAFNRKIYSLQSS